MTILVHVKSNTGENKMLLHIPCVGDASKVSKIGISAISQSLKDLNKPLCIEVSSIEGVFMFDGTSTLCSPSLIIVDRNTTTSPYLVGWNKPTPTRLNVNITDLDGKSMENLPPYFLTFVFE